MEAAFIGDDWAELREAQDVRRADAAYVIFITARDAYRAAAEITGQGDDPILDRLSNLDTQWHLVLSQPVDHLAAYYRFKRGFTQPFLPGIIPETYILATDWIGWLAQECLEWQRNHPRLVRNVCLTMTEQSFTKAVQAADELRAHLADIYQVPAARPQAV